MVKTVVNTLPETVSLRSLRFSLRLCVGCRKKELTSVITDRHPLAQWMRLASEHVAGIELATLETIVLVHAYAPVQHFCPACAAHAALACERQIDACRQRGVQDRRIAVAKFDLSLDSVADHRDDGVRRIVRLDMM